MSESRKQFEKEKAYDIAIINRRGEDYGIDEAITDYDIECEYSLWLKNKNKVLLEALKRAERKLRAYVGVCDGDKELTDTILPMCQKLVEEAIQGEPKDIYDHSVVHKIKLKLKPVKDAVFEDQDKTIQGDE